MFGLNGMIFFFKLKIKFLFVLGSLVQLVAKGWCLYHAYVVLKDPREVK